MWAEKRNLLSRTHHYIHNFTALRKRLTNDVFLLRAIINGILGGE
jgi:hypothetical protein